MRKLALILSWLALFHLSGFDLYSQARDGEVIIQLHHLADVSVLRSALAEKNIQQQLDTISLLSGHMNIWLLKFNHQAISNAEMLSEVTQVPGVIHAQPNHYISYRATPDDAQYGNQWALNNTGQTGGTPGADISAEEAWDIQTGGLTAAGDTIVIAVIDAGIDLDHEDLVTNLWKNRDEIPNNNMDDDSNGLTDDYNGWDFVRNTDSLLDNIHGTRVNGIAGAKGNNTVGISGVGWNIKIMPIVAAVVESSVVQAYSYVLEFRTKYNQSGGTEGAFVVATNSSFGIDMEDPANTPIWCAMYDTLGMAGILSAAATMNLNENVDSVGDVPSSCISDYLITVTSTNHNDAKRTNAAFGKTHVDIGAPGEGIRTTWPMNNYGDFGGTSSSSPFVTGTIGLLYASSCMQLIDDARIYPDSISLVIKDMILNNVDTIPSLKDITSTGGRLNAYESLLAAENYANCFFSSVDDAFLSQRDKGIIKVFPNPATDLITVAISAIEGNATNIVIANILGEAVGIQPVIPNARTEHYELDTSHLSAGIYFIYLSDGYIPTNKHKFVIY